MDESTTPIASVQSGDKSKATNMGSITLRLAGESFSVPRNIIWRPCGYVQDNLKDAGDDGSLAPIDLPWDDDVAPETLEWFLNLLLGLDPTGEGNGGFVHVLDIYGPDENRIECLAALPRLEKLCALMECNGIQKPVRRAAMQIIRQIHVPQDTDADLKQSVQQFDAAYRAWSETDTLVQHWTLIKFCTVVDVGHALSLEPDVSEQFRERALAHYEASVRRKAAASGGGGAASTGDVAA
ncbi:hypothetical protein PG985_002805 [Apiospora marii]|uniref:BTB domain-containing protein n=1 Tax=Apiospora marii TaxID=335849 RepID=A0ABR1RUY4_9PEZI